MSAGLATPQAERPRVRPRLGFLGVGWIGRHRLASVVESGAAEVAAVADLLPENARQAAAVSGAAETRATLDELLALDLDGIVIATPSALHADQCVAALERGIAVFCQKPLGRSAAETARVVDAARAADRLLAVDHGYRRVAGAEMLRAMVRRGELGRIFAVEAVFHNAYGPDAAWFHDPALSGGGCVMDLGVHLVDLVSWMLDGPRAVAVRSRLFAGGRPLRSRREQAEDYAIAELDLDSGAAVRLACSWNLSAGADAVIGVWLYGTGGGAALWNLNGSFHDFVAERFHGTKREVLATPPDAWGGRPIVDWVQRLARSPRFDPAAADYVDVAGVLDRIYAAHGRGRVGEEERCAVLT